MKVKLLTKTVKKVARALSHSAPEILTAAGVIASTAGVIGVGMASTKVEKVIDTANKELDDIKTDEEAYFITKKEAKKSKMETRMKTLRDLGLLYLPGVGLFVIGMACILSGGKLYKRRMSSLAGELCLTKAAFDKYRAAVRERYGDDIDKQIVDGVEKVKMKVVQEDGTVKTEEVLACDPDKMCGIYSFVYDETTAPASFEKGNTIQALENNLWYLGIQENLADDRFQAKGKLYLNDVLESIGMDDADIETFLGKDLSNDFGQDVGWVKGEVDHVRFNVQHFRNKLTGEYVITVNFNCVGNIRKKVAELKKQNRAIKQGMNLK